MNACSQHHVFDVGIVGAPTADVEAYQVFVCGNAHTGRIAKPVSKAAPAHKIITLAYCALVRLLLKDRLECAHACSLRVYVSLRN